MTEGSKEFIDYLILCLKRNMQVCISLLPSLFLKKQHFTHCYHTC